MIVVCDIDGTLANVLPWLHLLPKNWEEYFSHTHEFQAISQNVTLIQSLLDQEHFIYFITGRPESNREQTEKWIEKNFTLHSNSVLLMRQNDDFRLSYKFKLEHFRQINPSLIIDDEPDLIEHATKNGFHALQVHGYRDGNSDGIPFKNNEFRKKQFSFKEHAVGHQSPEQTLMILTYELGKVIEYNFKARIYGETAYYSNKNQQKEMSDLISMARYYCELKQWNFQGLMELGEEGYLERMEDIREYGIKVEEEGNVNKRKSKPNN